MEHLVFFEVKPSDISFIKKNLKNFKLDFFAEPLNNANLDQIKSTTIISTFIYSKLSASILKKLPKLRLIATRSTGFDHLDLAFCRKNKIAVANVPYYGENTVAEHTFALILTLSRNIHRSYIRTINHNYKIEGLEGFDLKDKVIGVVGAGHIGLHVIRAAKAFGMQVLAYDPKQDNFLAEVLDFQYCQLNELLSQADIISLHLPYLPQTHHLINRTNIKLIKKGSILINTARGGVIETEAMIQALEQNILAGIGLDVIEGEEVIKDERELLFDPQKSQKLGQLIKDHQLLNDERVVYTPHIAFYSREALERILTTTLDNIDNFLAGKKENQIT